MKIRAFILCAVVFLAATPLCAREKTDVIIMKNGDRLTCEIKALDSGALYVSLDYVLGTISLDWSKVRDLESSRLFIVKTEDGSAYTGKISIPESTGGRPVEIHVAETPEHNVAIERSQVLTMSPTSEKFWQRFNGNVNFGLTYSKGNQSTQFNFGSEAEYPRERWSAKLTYDSTLSSSSGASASTRNALGLSGMRLLRWDNWFYAGLGSLLQSSVQEIRLQSTIGGGIGRYLKNTNHATIYLLGGLAWQNTNYVQTIATQGSQNLVNAIIAGQANLFWFDKTNLNVSAQLYPALSQPGRVRFNTNVAYYIKIISKLSWNISFYGNWDNRPPAGFSGSDYGTSAGLTWKFGNK